jgi:hypothetical protein
MFFLVPLSHIRGQPTVLCHSRWRIIQELAEFAIFWGGTRFELGNSTIQSGTFPLSHLDFKHWRWPLFIFIPWSLFELSFISWDNQIQSLLPSEAPQWRQSYGEGLTKWSDLLMSLPQPAGTGWGAQSWTVFCGPAAVAIGGCERKD